VDGSTREETHHGKTEINVIYIISPPKVIISSPDMPMPCIDNSKYDNPQAICLMQYEMI
jgi:hypothetical protein